MPRQRSWPSTIDDWQRSAPLSPSSPRFFPSWDWLIRALVYPRLLHWFLSSSAPLIRTRISSLVILSSVAAQARFQSLFCYCTVAKLRVLVARRPQRGTPILFYPLSPLLSPPLPSSPLLSPLLPSHLLSRVPPSCPLLISARLQHGLLDLGPPQSLPVPPWAKSKYTVPQRRSAQSRLADGIGCLVRADSSVDCTTCARCYFVRARERERRVVLVSFSSGGMGVKVMERGGSWRKYAKRRRERGAMREL